MSIDTRRKFLAGAALAAAGVALGRLAPIARAAAKEERKPNIVVIFTDDHGFADLGSQDVFKDVKTPNLDALASGGVRMSSGYVTAPQENAVARRSYHRTLPEPVWGREQRGGARRLQHAGHPPPAAEGGGLEVGSGKHEFSWAE